eukprot:scaffold105602_cov30-Tisochrysis_lutea.AAC.2
MPAAGQSVGASYGFVILPRRHIAHGAIHFPQQDSWSGKYDRTAHLSTDDVNGPTNADGRHDGDLQGHQNPRSRHKGEQRGDQT